MAFVSNWKKNVRFCPIVLHSKPVFAVNRVASVELFLFPESQVPRLQLGRVNRVMMYLWIKRNVRGSAWSAGALPAGTSSCRSSGQRFLSSEGALRFPVSGAVSFVSLCKWDQPD